MKAVFFNQHGGPEVLQYGDFPDPTPDPGSVTVRLQAAALNRMDIWVRNGWPGQKLDLPHIPGADGAGVVTAVTPPIPPGFQIAPGDRVVINSNLGCGTCDACQAGRDNLCRDWRLLGESLRGTYAEYACVPARQVYRLPDGLDFQAAAAAALVFHTAWHSLVRRGQVQAGEWVLVVGASGGVNTASIQVARSLGATVVAVGSGAEKLALAASLGARHLVDRSREPDWPKAVFNLTGRRGVDVVVDNVGTTFPSSLRTLRKGGRLLTVGNTGGAQVAFDNRFVFGKHLSILGSSMGALADFDEVLTRLGRGEFKAVLDRAYPLAEARQAQGRLEAGEQLGKVTLSIP
ncbi:MAG: zinc-binding dehydrogenase [Chloroflexi bacterium]|nr:zinc-binding dehydrogenase [Chloroflexota bacterium]